MPWRPRMRQTMHRVYTGSVGKEKNSVLLNGTEGLDTILATKARFFSAATASQRDFFVLPPSGHMYPGHTSPPVHTAFVTATEHGARIMSSSG
jgi:hypothetical protein